MSERYVYAGAKHHRIIAALYVPSACEVKKKEHCFVMTGAQTNQAGECYAGGDDNPYTMSWRGIDNRTYYMVDTSQYIQLLNYSGCGNTVSGNHPVTKQLIIDSCKRWVPPSQL